MTEACPVCNDPQCVIYLHRSPEMNSSRSPQRKIGDKAGAPIEIQHRNKKRAYHRKIRLIHRSFQWDFGGESRVRVSALGQWFFFASGENSGGRPEPADTGAPVAAVRADDDDGEYRQDHDNNKQNVRLTISQ